MIILTVLLFISIGLIIYYYKKYQDMRRRIKELSVSPVLIKETPNTINYRANITVSKDQLAYMGDNVSEYVRTELVKQLCDEVSKNIIVESKDTSFGVEYCITLGVINRRRTNT